MPLTREQALAAWRDKTASLAAYCAQPLVLDGVKLRGQALLRHDRPPAAHEWRTGLRVLNANTIVGTIDGGC